MSLMSRRDRQLFALLFAVYAAAFLVILYVIPLTITAILDIAQSLLTVEAVLLGLTPIIEKPRHRALPFTVGIFAVLVSVITLTETASAKETGIGGPYNWILMFIDAEVFVIMMAVYYLSVVGRSFGRLRW